MANETKSDNYTFVRSYAEANFISRFTMWYGNRLIDSVNKNNGQLTKSMVEDINLAPENT